MTTEKRTTDFEGYTQSQLSFFMKQSYKFFSNLSMLTSFTLSTKISAATANSSGVG